MTNQECSGEIIPNVSFIVFVSLNRRQTMYVTELFFYCAVAMFLTGCIYVVGNVVSNLEERN